ncbi:MAG: DUF3592 domain-containing protein [Pseudomonadota bacterium]
MWGKAIKYLLVGALFLVIGTVFVVSSQGFIKRSEPAQLLVLRIENRRDSDGDTLYRPVFALDSEVRPRPEYAGGTWMRPMPHKTGDIVPGRYVPETGEMRSDAMMGKSSWMGRIAQILGGLAMLQGVLVLFGVPDALMPLRVNERRRRRRWF